ncbi:MAG: TIGR00341 family protein [Candidatus Ranarchaeia archaeon]
MNQIHITIPNDPLKQIDLILTNIKENIGIQNLILLKGDNNSLIIFRAKRTQTPEILTRLENIGVGVRSGIIDIVPLSACVPEKASTTKIEEDSKIRERISTEEIRKNILDASKIGLTYPIFIIIASILSNIGLLLNSPTLIIASMILSPLLGPILAISFGSITKDKKIIINGLKGQFIGVILGFLSGIIMGFALHLVNPTFQVTNEMAVRAFPTGLDLLIALCAGIGVGFSVTGSIQSALVGVAIAVALLPPLTNSGLAFSLQFFDLGIGSLILAAMNITIINVCALIIFKIKGVSSLPMTSFFWRGPKEPSQLKNRKW